MASEQPLAFLVYVAPDFVTHPRPAAPVEIAPDKEDNLPPLELEDGPPPPDAIVLSASSRIQSLRQSLAGIGFPAPLFPEAAYPDTWPETRRRLPNKRQVVAVKCLVKLEHVSTFREWVQHPSRKEDGIQCYTPHRTQKTLLVLGYNDVGSVQPILTEQRQRAAAFVSHEARQRRHHSLYIYTTARTPGRIKTLAAGQLDVQFGKLGMNLPPARLHVLENKCGTTSTRVTAYCYKMPEIGSAAFLRFTEDILTLHNTDQKLRIAVRSPRAAVHLNNFIATLDNAVAERLCMLIGPSKALAPEWKWLGGTPVLRNSETCTDTYKSNSPEVAPSPRLSHAVASEAAEAGTETAEAAGTISDHEVVFTIFDGSAANNASTARLHQLLGALPNGPQFQPAAVVDAPAAALRVPRDNTDRVEEFLSALQFLQQNDFRFIVNVEAELWFDDLLDNYSAADSAVMRQVWVRQT